MSNFISGLLRLFPKEIRKRWLAKPKTIGMGGINITNVQTVKHFKGVSALNKANRLVLKGKTGDRKVKIYECYSTAHASFIRSVSSHPDLGKYFPKVISGSGVFLVTEWIEGKSTEKEINQRNPDSFLKELITLQQQIHSYRIEGLPETGFDYWHDFILPRFERACSLLGKPYLFKEVADLAEPLWSDGEKYLLHPDLTPANLVRKADNSLVIIDNEILTTGGSVYLDVFNTYHSLGKSKGSLYLEKWAQAAGKSIEKKERAPLEAIWLARQCGSKGISANISALKKLIENYERGISNLPV